MMRLAVQPRRGIATLLVTSAVALCAMLGLVMLAIASTSAHSAGGTTASLSAEALADSGVDLALYYLTTPLKSPGYDGTYWKGQSNISLGGSVPGEIDVTVTSVGQDLYSIESTGRYHGGGGDARRTVAVTAYAFPGFLAKQGAAFSASAVTLPSGAVVQSGIQVNGALTNLGIIRGTALCTSVPVLGTLLGGWQPVATSPMRTSIPTSDKIRDYRTYTYRGRTYTAVDVPDHIPAGAVYGPSESNPAGVFRRLGQMNLDGAATFNGTLIVEGGPVYLNAGTSTITPAAEGFPAAIIKGDLILRGLGSSRALNISGLAYVKGGLKSGSLTGGSLNFDGALLVEGGTIATGFPGNINIAYNADRVCFIDLDTTVAPAVARIKSYKK